MSRYLVLYLVPSSVIEDWSKTDPDVRKPAEEKMRAEWGKWMGEYGPMLTVTEAAGKTKRATPDGIADAKNDVLMYSFIEAETHEAAAMAFRNHPHLQIPQASIEITAVRAMTGVE